jgi:hemoglobin-like flavoprotein
MAFIPQHRQEQGVNQNQIDLVQQSWQELAGIRAKVGGLFYDKLFSIDPALGLLFRGDLREQGDKLVSMIDAAVQGLSDPEPLLTTLALLGMRHKGYGVRSQDYETVGKALLSTLSLGLGAKFSSEVQAAWMEAYTLIASTMQSGAGEMAA